MAGIVFAVAMVVFLGAVMLLLRRFLASHDEIYDGLTPGVLPPRKEWKATPVKLLRSPEYKGPFPVAFTPPRDVTPGLIPMTSLRPSSTSPPADSCASKCSTTARASGAGRTGCFSPAVSPAPT